MKQKYKVGPPPEIVTLEFKTQFGRGFDVIYPCCGGWDDIVCEDGVKFEPRRESRRVWCEKCGKVQVDVTR